MTQVILHVGPHKTGTTYIQETLANLRDTLHDRGIGVPSIWEAAPGLPSHMRLVWAIRNGELELLKNQIAALLARGYRDIVISCEALSRLEPGQLLRLRGLLGSVSVRVVYYVRRAPERMPSLWQEEVKFGHYRNFLEFLTHQLSDFAVSEFRDARAVDRFAAAFGATRISLVAYSNLVDRNIDIADHFLSDVLGVTDVALPPARRPNQSLPVPDTELIRALNAIEAELGGQKSTAIREWYLRRRDVLMSDRIAAAMRRHADVVRLDEASPPFAAALQDLITRYGTAIIGPRWEHGLHSPRAVAVPVIRSDYLLDAGVTDALRRVHELYRQSL